MTVEPATGAAEESGGPWRSPRGRTPRATGRPSREIRRALFIVTSFLGLEPDVLECLGRLAVQPRSLPSSPRRAARSPCATQAAARWLAERAARSSPRRRAACPPPRRAGPARAASGRARAARCRSRRGSPRGPRGAPARDAPAPRPSRICRSRGAPARASETALRGVGVAARRRARRRRRSSAARSPPRACRAGSSSPPRLLSSRPTLRSVGRAPRTSAFARSA